MASPKCHAAYEAMMARIRTREGVAPEFLQAVEEVANSLIPIFEDNPMYMRIFEVIAEPERVIVFKVPWETDDGTIKVNRGFRVQFSSALGPYKGGMRFHPSVNLSILKFLGFEQIFKNSLTTLPMGGGKGGSDFDPKGKSECEVRRFCCSMVNELQRHIGADVDVPAGDIGVGGREIGYMYGQYKKIANESVGVLTGKNPKWGGSLIRPEATGYGAVYYCENWLKSKNESFEGKRCVVSGSGNVAQYCMEKLLELGAVVLTLSDSSGTIVEENGFTREKLLEVMELKNEQRGRLAEYHEKHPTCTYYPDKSVWDIEIGSYDCAFPCATQNEIDEHRAVRIGKSGCRVVVEGANMPSDEMACSEYVKNDIVLCPAKAANAGGVAVSGLEMAQNSMRLSWTREEVDKRLKDIMKSIYDSCTKYGAMYGTGPDDLVAGANIAGFLKVADSMLQLGWAA